VARTVLFALLFEADDEPFIVKMVFSYHVQLSTGSANGRSQLITGGAEKKEAKWRKK